MSNFVLDIWGSPKGLLRGHFWELEKPGDHQVVKGICFDVNREGHETIPLESMYGMFGSSTWMVYVYILMVN